MSLFSDGFSGGENTIIEAGVGSALFDSRFPLVRHLPGFKAQPRGARCAAIANFSFQPRMAVGPETKNDRMRLLPKADKEESRDNCKGKEFSGSFCHRDIL